MQTRFCREDFQMTARCLMVMLFCFSTAVTSAAEPLVQWNFAREDSAKDLLGWKANAMVADIQQSEQGLSFTCKSPDPFLTSPVVDCPADQVLVVTLRMRSTGSTTGQLYFGQQFSETNSRNFSVKNDGQWYEYQITLPSPGAGTRFRLDPSNTDGKAELAWVRIEAFVELPKERWATPRELRDKKFIGGGLYTVYGEETAITPSFLAEHPEFVDSYPFDGIVIPAVLSPDWVKRLGLTKMGQPWLPKYLNELLWNKIRIPDKAVEQTLADLKSMRRGSLTDNYLIVGMVDGARGLKTPDLANDTDWAIIEYNARLAARICRDAKLKGVWLDTEQYGYYRWRTDSGIPEFDPDKPQQLHFPLGKDSPELLRRRGEQWIKAIQSEFPEVKIITTFAWSPDSEGYGPLKGVIPFLDGVLNGIEEPGQIHHAHENTFYFGHAKGTTHTYATENGFPGDRNRYESSRTEIQGWRSLSNSAEKYDKFVQVGMAAWVEDHPWNVPDGWPVGGKATLWSNLPLALAYSNEYVWVWSEHTKYGQPHLREPNPFLASLNNQTFNTKQESVTSFVEDFETDPMLHGWYFDFDMLAIGRKVDPAHETAVMSTDSIPYRWDGKRRALQITGTNSPSLASQRRRFVRPIDIESSRQNFQALIEFRIDSFGSGEGNPMVLGLFNSERSMTDVSLTLQIADKDNLTVVAQKNGASQTLPLELGEELKVGDVYQVFVNCVGANRETVVRFSNLTRPSVPPRSVQPILPEAFFRAGLDELGVAIYESTSVNATDENAYRYAVLKTAFNHP